MGTVSGDSLAVSAVSSAANETVRGYRPELDALRFLAFFLVFIHHLCRPVRIGAPFLFFRGANGWRIQLSLMEMSALGLCLFFTLSAYLITDLLLREREKNSTISVRKFYIRRALRIWPLYFVGIGIGVLIGSIIHDARHSNAILFFLFFAGNFYGPIFGLIPNPMHPLWSISIEEQFYLLWPWAIRFFSKRGLLFCALLFVLAANITLFHYGQRHVETESVVWPNTFVQFEMFAAGIFLALRRAPTRPNLRLGLLLVLLAAGLWFIACFRFGAKQPAAAGTAISGFSLIIGYALIAAGCAALLRGFCFFDSSRIPAWAAKLGKISYGLYVFHNLAIEFAGALFHRVQGLAGIAGTAVLGFLLTVSAALISYTFLESPFLRLKRRFEFLHSRPI